MPFTSIPTEQTTALTDVGLLMLAAGCALYLRRWHQQDPWKVGIWTWVLALLGAASALGAVVHGLTMTEDLRTMLWRPLFLALGLVVALFVVGAIHDWRGRTAARRIMPFMLAVGVGFFGVTQIASGAFVVFVAYEAVAMVFALVIYILAWRRGRPTAAGTVALAIVLNIVAAGIQASTGLSLTVVLPFDHNGLFHVAQMIAVLVLVGGLGSALRSATRVP